LGVFLFGELVDDEYDEYTLYMAETQDMYELQPWWKRAVRANAVEEASAQMEAMAETFADHELRLVGDLAQRRHKRNEKRLTDYNKIGRSPSSSQVSGLLQAENQLERLRRDKRKKQLGRMRKMQSKAESVR